MNHVIRHDVDEIRYCTTVQGCIELLFCWKLVRVYRLIVLCRAACGVQYNTRAKYDRDVSYCILFGSVLWLVLFLSFPVFFLLVVLDRVRD